MLPFRRSLVSRTSFRSGAAACPPFPEDVGSWRGLRVAAEAAARRAAFLAGTVGSVGVGGVTGAGGQVAQNWVTNRPLFEGVPQAAISGAATLGGMHLGMGYFEQMAHTIALTADSKLKARSPDSFHDAMNAIFDGQESLRVPADQFETYFQGQNMDPARVAENLGVQNYAEAKTAGSDLEIPQADFHSKLDREHQEGLYPSLKDPRTNMTLADTVQGQKDLQEWAAGAGPEKLQEMMQGVDEETKAQPEYQQVKQDLKQRFLDAGETEPIAEANATIVANQHAYLARETGRTPTEVLALANPQVRLGEAPEGGTLAQGPGDDTFYQSATLRSGKETLQKYGLDPEGSYTTREVAAALEARQRAKYGTIAADDRSPQARDRIAKWMQTEVEFEMQNPEKSGVGWYSEKFQRALDRMGDAYPELQTDKSSSQPDDLAHCHHL